MKTDRTVTLFSLAPTCTGRHYSIPGKTFINVTGEMTAGSMQYCVFPRSHGRTSRRYTLAADICAFRGQIGAADDPETSAVVVKLIKRKRQTLSGAANSELLYLCEARPY